MFNYAFINFELNRIDKAKEVIDELCTAFDENTDPGLVFVLNLSRARLMIHNNRLDDVYNLLEESLNNPNIDKTINNKIDYYMLFSKYFEKMRNIEMAIVWYEKGINSTEELIKRANE